MVKIKRAIVGSVFVVAFLGGLQLSGIMSQTKAFRFVTSKASAISAKPAKATIPPATTVVADMDTAIASDSDVEASATLIDLDNGQTYNAGESTTVFKAASTAKVLAAVDYLHEVEQGKATLTQNINGTSAQQLMKQMIEVSDNNAWTDLNDYLGDQQQSYAASIGMTNFVGNDYNTMTTIDEAKLLEQLYQGKLINSSHRALLYSFMANTDSDNLIPAALPSGATVYHKYGELWGNLHDAAIVSYEGHHFVLVIFTKNPDNTVDDYDTRVTLIHTITKAAFSDVVGNSVSQ